MLIVIILLDDSINYKHQPTRSIESRFVNDDVILSFNTLRLCASRK